MVQKPSYGVCECHLTDFLGMSKMRFHLQSRYIRGHLDQAERRRPTWCPSGTGKLGTAGVDTRLDGWMDGWME